MRRRGAGASDRVAGVPSLVTWLRGDGVSFMRRDDLYGSLRSYAVEKRDEMRALEFGEIKMCGI